MKILMLQDFFGIGLQYQENLLTDHYIRQGHKVVVICSTFENVFDYIADRYNPTLPKKTEEYNGAKIIRLPYSLNFMNKLRKHSGVYEIICNEKPDLIYAHDIHLNLSDASKYAKKNRNCKIIMDYHSDFSNSANHWLSVPILHKIIRKRFLYRYLNHLARIYPVVPASEVFLNKVYNVPYSRMDLLPLGCDYKICKETMNSVDKSKLRRQYGIKNNDIVIFTGGKFNPEKRTEIAVRALKKLNADNVHLIIIGEAGPDHKIYEEKLKAEAIGTNTHFTGMVNAQTSYELMAISDVALYPASQSVLWQQSIGMHLPLIAGDTGDQDMSYLNKNGNVIKISKENINENFIADILKSLIFDSNYLNTMKNGAMKTAQEYLDYDVIAKRTLEVLM
ncbi:glycosyltransferase family 4 protein [Chryseobacterium gleum]|uniref:glycosyltransferase family 4 protein n=1 Tax=Chryseobacterium gleum TaxID=250 RepID=UPI001E599F44|nr:glycosyltransferase family 4 protein [Chryseobacterium gleum]MCD9616541.1 glycosyltransferase family 4 protein [Chryseobacterium gleum]MCE4066098.1 glycosyltransferase family 4 protein [Chryseobacterium gleum]